MCLICWFEVVLESYSKFRGQQSLLDFSSQRRGASGDLTSHFMLVLSTLLTQSRLIKFYLNTDDFRENNKIL